MGTWDAGSFDNDDAQDWVWELVEGENAEPIVEAIAGITEEEDYIKAPECQQAIAAAEVVAAMKGHFAPDLPEEVVAWVKAHDKRPTERLVRLAQQAVERIKRDSELQALWEEGEAASWYKNIADLQDRLGR